MNRGFKTLTLATALFAGTATLALIPSPAEAASTEEAVAVPNPSQEILSAMKRDLGLDGEQARRRLVSEATAARLEKKVRENLSTTFGGAWLGQDGSTLIVGVTDEASARYVRGLGAEPRLVARSEKQLDKVKSTLDRNAKRADRTIHGWYVDPVTNSVVVLARDPSLSSVGKFIADSGAADGSVRVITSSEEPRTTYDLRGGDAYYPGNARCSIGFSVNGGFVTAGHCGGVGTNTSGSNGVAQGTVRGSTFPGNDYGWVQVNSAWASQPWVNNYAGGIANVAGSNEAPVGASVCRSGSTTGWRCGVIQAKNVTVNYAQGAVYGLTQSNACCEGGDSGGSWLSGDQAQGVTSGGSGNCTTGGTTFFQPLRPILSVYGLTLTTSGGQAIVSNWNGKCIDIPNSNTTDGTPLQMWDCNGTGAQRWTFYSDGTVRALGKCMDVAWGSRDNGAVIQLVACNGNPAQQFVLSGAGDLVNPQANKCVDIKEWNSASGARLHLWECGGTANQKWFRR
ncbi:ricin-type beta-trefoil lectin domain protein [Archangium violaceum]|uniref:ricin-type beta-trefoil lectin domain protein n=1 Tax=Archangium violaceum TaxID=83451 RepID=UPI002B2CC489|nr:ricin-type beta-trefoil lectin domain protein [Archangium gephyra]